MKLSLGLFWTLIMATTETVQFGSSYVLPNRIPVDQYEGLLTDSGNEVGSQNGTDIIITQPGLLDVSVTQHEELIFGVFEQQCNGEFLACYKADPPGQNVLTECDTGCGFYVAGHADDITYMRIFEEEYTGREKKYEYAEMVMRNGTTILNDKQQGRIPSCSPKIENGMVHLRIQNATSECPVIIKNATIKLEQTTPPPSALGSTSEPNTVPEAEMATTTESSTSIGDYWYLFLIFGLLIAAIVIAILVICFIKRRNRSKKVAAPRRKLRDSQSPIVAQPSHEAVAPPSYLSQSSIFSHKSMLLSKKEQKQEKVAAATAETKEPEETDLTSIKPTA